MPPWWLCGINYAWLWESNMGHYVHAEEKLIGMVSQRIFLKPVKRAVRWLKLLKDLLQWAGPHRASLAWIKCLIWSLCLTVYNINANKLPSPTTTTTTKHEFESQTLHRVLHSFPLEMRISSIPCRWIWAGPLGLRTVMKSYHSNMPLSPACH